jgi:glycosyltransferase involved in cell wall biosynthesis
MLTQGLIAPLSLHPQTTHQGAVVFEDEPAEDPSELLDEEFLRRCAWEIGETRAAERYVPSVNHAGVAMIAPSQGFAHWRILPSWVEKTAAERGGAWHQCRLICRLYDVSYIEFNGFNAHRLQDHDLPALEGHIFFGLPRPGTCQLAEVGFLLKNSEFIPAARSEVVAFARDATSGTYEQKALLVAAGVKEDVPNLWDYEKVLKERRQPRLRRKIRIATLSLGAEVTGANDPSAHFISELTREVQAQGHEVHMIVPATEQCHKPCEIDGVHYHPLDIELRGAPPKQAYAFSQAALKRLNKLRSFDLFHFHEWMTSLTPWINHPASVLSVTSTEVVRRNGSAPSDFSLNIERAEREVAAGAGCILTPDWLQTRAASELGVDGCRIRAFPMEGRLANEWECELDFGQVKREIYVGPVDRLITFVGPLEHGAGPDLLVEAMPTLLSRWPNLRLALVGCGNMHGHLDWRMHQLGVAHAVRLLGHVESGRLSRILRSSIGLVLPSRYRVPFDDSVVELARRAGRPVITTHGGPTHVVRHEENGLITYDNPGSMVWAIDRLCGDPGHADRMGHRGRCGNNGNGTTSWSDVAKHYLELCAILFPELT